MAKKADEVTVDIKDSDLVYMVHPTTEGNPPSEVPYGAFRDCWSHLGWELASADQAAGETVAEPDTAAVKAALVDKSVEE